MSRPNVVRMRLFSLHFPIFALSLLFAATMTSCSESNDEDTEYQNWETRNNEYFENVYQQAKVAIDAGDGSWLIVKSYTKVNGLKAYAEGVELGGSHTDCIVAHVVSQREGTEHNEASEINSSETLFSSPLYIDTVRVHYRGRLIPSASYSDGKMFDSSWQGTYDVSTMVPAKMSLAGLVDGFATAVMSMHVGDRWEVYVPWQLGYGSSSSSSSIPNCSVLRFDITLHSFCKPGTVMPIFK